LSYTKKSKNKIDFAENLFFVHMALILLNQALPKYQLESLDYPKNVEAENQSICASLNSEDKHSKIYKTNIFTAPLKIYTTLQGEEYYLTQV